MKRWFILFLCLALTCTALYFVGREQPTELQEAVRSGEMMRIHILANDDSAEQQAVKLKVRDAILEAFTPLFAEVSSARESMEIVRENLSLAANIAARTVREEGYTYPINAQFGVFEFPERVYGGQVVPAGEYTALRIELGEGKGKNWWCVMYPPLCFFGEDYIGEVQFESSILKWFKQWKEEWAHEKDA